MDHVVVKVPLVWATKFFFRDCMQEVQLSSAESRGPTSRSSFSAGKQRVISLVSEGGALYSSASHPAFPGSFSLYCGPWGEAWRGNRNDGFYVRAEVDNGQVVCDLAGHRGHHHFHLFLSASE
jgi:hypothetical protein